MPSFEVSVHVDANEIYIIASRGGKSTKILYLSKSMITWRKFYSSKSKSTGLKNVLK